MTPCTYFIWSTISSVKYLTVRILENQEKCLGEISTNRKTARENLYTFECCNVYSGKQVKSLKTGLINKNKKEVYK